ncbi:MAG: RNB domain-containing ribonuclease, partial [Candidatus Riflebacteria bacterium]|nr:RNB domain-containing ribonuclease [Candidatus Riflebacteria bacterium]
MNFFAGQAVEFSDKESGLRIGIVMSISGKGVRVLLANRKETTLTERAILHATSLARSSTSDIDRCVTAAQELDERRRTMAAAIDLEQLHALLADDIRPYSLSELADFSGDSSDEDFSAALLRRLHGDSCYFREKKDGWHPVSRAEMEETKARAERRSAQEAEDEAFLADMKAAWEQPPKELPPRLAEHIDHLVDIVVKGEKSVVSRKLHDLLQKGGWMAPRKLFTLLVKLGRFDPDENLLVIEHQVPTEFDSVVIAEADALKTSHHTLSSQPDSSTRQDLRDLPVWAIDSVGTRDRDDAFSIRQASGGTTTLWVHITDVASFIRPDSALDREGLRRGTSIYMPDGNIPMLPSNLSEDLMSLNEGAERHVISIHMIVDAVGSIVEYAPVIGIVRVTRAIDYQEGDRLVSAGEPYLIAAMELAARLREKRKADGALIISRPELEIRAIDGVVQIVRKFEKSSTAEMVAEFMIWANHLAALWCRDHGVPALYRIQEKPEQIIEMGEKFDAVRFYQAIRQFKRTVISTKPGRHGCL